ncbi:MAG: formate acetyltransferase, partial [Desulfovibrionales bacterium]|nr:formate acetyltransferase [Desulfovibrionales bacterium]
MWKSFKSGQWQKTIDVRDFIQTNYTPYLGDESFLENKTQKTSDLWDRADALIKEEIRKGIIDIETSVFSGINNFNPGYLDKENEVVVGFQADAPLKRIMNPYGGLRMVQGSLKAYDYEVDPDLIAKFTEFRKT